MSVSMTTCPTTQYNRMTWNEDQLWALIKRLKGDERTKDIVIVEEDKYGRFTVTLKRNMKNDRHGL